jgi:hypothetical protein
MQTASFKYKSGKRTVTRDQILEGMKKFDQDYRGQPGVKDSGLGYFVQENGKRYSPKWVLSLATGVPRNEFNGGDQTNEVLLALGFDIRDVEDENTDEPKLEQAEEATERIFEIERDLQAALRSHIEQLEQGLKITDGGKEQEVEAGRIDITAEDKNGATVVIELKAGKADRNAIGQILGYMGNMTKGKNLVRGILVAGEFPKRAVAAASVVPNLQLKRYSFNFTFEPIVSK